MSFLLNNDSFYFVLPVVLATLVTFFVFNLPFDYFVGALFLLLISLVALAFDILPNVFKRNLSDSIYLVKKQPRLYSDMAVLFAFLVLLFCGIDLLVNGIVLLNPELYANLNGPGKVVRNISNMCWVLVPVAFYCVDRKFLKIVLIASALIFPVLFVDRNRLLMSVFCIVWLYLISSDNSFRKLWKVLVGLFLAMLIFVMVGVHRSGEEAFLVPSSGVDLVENQFPLKDWFSNLPLSGQQVLLYVGVPIFNFATVDSLEFVNVDFLNQQLSPFSRTNLYPDSPVLVQRFNVGTEFFPFLMAGGKSLVFLVFMIIYVFFVLFKYVLRIWPNIFTLLIFMRIAYVVLMMGFAPQFYVLTNFAFIGLCLGLWFFSAFSFSVLKKINRKLVK